MFVPSIIPHTPLNLRTEPKANICAHSKQLGAGGEGSGWWWWLTSLGFYAALVVNYYYLPQRSPWHWTCRGAVYFHFFIYCALFSQSSRFVFVNFEYGLGQRSVSNSKRRLQHCIMNSSIDKRVTKERYKQREREGEANKSKLFHSRARWNWFYFAISCCKLVSIKFWHTICSKFPLISNPNW